MIGYTERCPYCGAENRNLLLEDSNGWMECSRCLRLTRFQGNWSKENKAVYPRKAEITRAS